MSVPVNPPRVRALRLTCAYGRMAAVLVCVGLLALAVALAVAGCSLVLIALLAVAALVLPFLIVLLTEICELLYDTLVPK